MHLPRVTLLIPALILFACDPPKGDLGEYSTTDTSGGTTDTSGSETGTTADDPPGVPIDPLCEDPADPSKERGTVSFNPPRPYDDLNFAGTCAVVSSTGTGLSLDCDGTTVGIQIVLDDVAPPLHSFGDQVVLDYRAVMSFGTDEWFTLRGLDDTLLLAGVAAQELEPPDALGFFAPLGLSKVKDVCQTPVTCDDMSQKLAVNLAYGDADIQVFSRHHALIDEFRVSVANARRHYQEVQEGNEVCAVFDVPEYWFSTLIRRVSE